MGTWAKRALMLVAAMAVMVVHVSSAAWAQQRRECSDFGTQEEAQAFFQQQGGAGGAAAHLDVDGDGQACEGLPTSGTRPSPTPTAVGTATPAPTATPSGALPKNGAATTAIALSGLSFLEAGFGLTLLAKRMGVRRRAVPLYLLRKLARATSEGRHEIALTDDVYLVHRTGAEESKAGLVVPLIIEEPRAPVLTELDVALEDPASRVHASIDTGEAPVRWGRKSATSWTEWPFFTPPAHDERPREDSNLRHPV